MVRPLPESGYIGTHSPKKRTIRQKKAEVDIRSSSLALFMHILGLGLQTSARIGLHCWLFGAYVTSLIKVWRLKRVV